LLVPPPLDEAPPDALLVPARPSLPAELVAPAAGELSPAPLLLEQPPPSSRAVGSRQAANENGRDGWLRVMAV